MKSLPNISLTPIIIAKIVNKRHITQKNQLHM